MDTQFITRVEETLAQIHKTLVAAISEAVRQHPQQEAGEGGDVVVPIEEVYLGSPTGLTDNDEMSKLILTTHGLFFCVDDIEKEYSADTLDHQTLLDLYYQVAQQEVA